MNPVVFQLLQTIIQVLGTQGNRLTALEEEESRESAEEAAIIQQAQELLVQLAQGVPTMPPGIPPMPSDII